MTKRFVAMFCLLMIQPAQAGDLGFQTTAGGITDALIDARKGAGIQTRGLKGLGSARTRGVVVVTQDAGKMVRDTIQVPEGPAGHGVRLRVRFDVASAGIRPESHPLLNALGAALTGEKLAGIPVTIRGHTDSDGEAAYNLALSLRRGISVKRYLTSHFAISPSLLKVVGYGEAVPLVPNSSPANKQVNRRVEITAMP